MKIFIKKSHLCNPDGNSIIYIAKIFFETTISNNELLLNTIDYEEYIETNGEIEWQYLMDEILKDFAHQEFTQIIEFSKNLIVISSDLHPGIESLSKIYLYNLCMGLQVVAYENDFSFLEKHLIKSEHQDIIINDSGVNELPAITDYIAQHPDSFKTVYYPGAGDDFSSLQLFGKYSNTENIYFSDYYNTPEIISIRERLDERGEDTLSLMPSHFKRGNWSDFWPDENDDWFDANQIISDIINPIYSWGRKIKINHPNQLNKTFDFYYLGTEAIKTAEILIKNRIYPDVLVLQDHGTGGNWTVFGGENSPLYSVMKNNLPKYLLLEPRCENDIWPGYNQVTKPYAPGIQNANPMHMNKRALYERISD
jgi:hypothetical protein